ncbi:helicase-like transcription factor CHR28 [Momordica charantia]|uniref:Helicase-like transcription factor CHR28 n=1 Tax=Momordica charantia TaxID=3673 RepID=A0A6J1CJR9_MOMCH|nr:helicase-like transcription factor CHR28 [Momordica charantia]
MSTTNLIEISSSDSDFSLEYISDGEDVTPSIGESSHSRKLPHWASTDSSSQGNSGQFHASSRSSLNVNNSPHSGSNGDTKYLTENGNAGLPRTVNSRIATTAGADYERLSSQQAFKRTLPYTSQSYAPPTKSNNLVDNLGSIQIRDEAVGSENRDFRVLPVSLAPGKSIPSSQYPSEHPYRPGYGEELAPGSDERLIYQAALEDLNQPKLEANLPDGLLSVPLLRHQKIALAWMLQKETRSLHCLGGILADDQGLGKTVSMISLIQMQRSLQSKAKLEDGSEKKAEALNLDDDDDNGTADSDKMQQTGVSDDVKPILEVKATRQISKRRPAAGTLVVCPASILRQWARELDEKVTEEAKLLVLIYHGGSRTRDPDELAKYDVVLTTYSIVTNEVPKQPLVDEDDAEEKNGERYGLSSDFSINRKRKKTSMGSKKSRKGRKGTGISIECDSGPLARVGWFRVILDEAQTIKNHRTQVARACCSLRAKRRWCLSGTPIQNAIDDLYSYFRFLRYDPYAVYKSFYNTIKVPISRNSVHGYKKLQAVLRAIMLRRTKGTLIDGEPIVKLPPKTIRLTKVDFSTEERDFYTQLEADSRKQFKAYAAAGTVKQNYANILLMLLRLRQACDHPLLVKGCNTDSVGKDSTEMASKLPKEMLMNLLNRLETSLAICRVCDDPPENPVVTMCGHVFCYQCVSEYLTGDDNMCPALGCKEQVAADVVFSKTTLRKSISDDLDGGSTSSGFSEKSLVHSEYSSSKIRAVLEILQTNSKASTSTPVNGGSFGCNGGSIHPEDECIEICDSDVDTTKHTSPFPNPTEGPVKTIVFSQWTGMLDLVETSLNLSCIQYRRLDGTMSLVSRDRAVKDFNTDPEITVMLMSLKAGNLGLNMVAACHVILLDLWWNPTTEDQAVDRAHRIGQTRPVTVSRITIKDTVEDRILALQEEKRKMVASAFGEDQSGGSASRLTVEDLRYLFMV